MSRSIHYVTTIPIVTNVVTPAISDAVAARDEDAVAPNTYCALRSAAIPTSVTRVMAVDEHICLSLQTSSSATSLRERRR